MTTDTSEHERHMRRCIELARQALATTDTPVGSLIVRHGVVVAEGVEAVRARRDVTAHAEIEAVRAALADRHADDLDGCTLYTTVEPCVMCAYAIRLARLSVVVSGVRTSDSGPVGGLMILTDPEMVPNRPTVLVTRDVLAAECQAVLNERPRPRDRR